MTFLNVEDLQSMADFPEDMAKLQQILLKVRVGVGGWVGRGRRVRQGGNCGRGIRLGVVVGGGGGQAGVVVGGGLVRLGVVVGGGGVRLGWWLGEGWSGWGW